VARFTRLVPILFVADLAAERDFYLRLGMKLTYEGPEFPDFVALGDGPIEFGLERRATFDTSAPDRVLTWQLSITDVDDVARRLASTGVGYTEERIRPRDDWSYRVLHTRTPNGYHLLLEGEREDDAIRDRRTR
jgi:catechol 2,3-dioxygenase-like lactoylglutathione lyase family enzyme